MDARTQSKAIPLVVDLDGTLVCTDLLWEGLIKAARSNPLILIMALYWLMSGGKTLLKEKIALRAVPNPIRLPYRKDLLIWLNQEKKSGRTIVLATASHKIYAEAVADHCGLFDRVFATDLSQNLSGANKRDALNAEFGDGGYDYVGNARDDLPIFDAARQAIIAGPDSHARAWHVAHGGLKFENEPISFKVFLKLIRCHQWLKNILIAVPLVLSHELANIPLVLAIIAAFFSFSFAASAIYIVNDLLDLESDRGHATKNKRPLAAGLVPIPMGLMISAGLICASLALALLLPLNFLLVLIGYLIATTAYSFAIKSMLLIDVLCLASLYIIRIIAGAAAIDVGASFWLLAFAGFFFLSLALVKRYVELRTSKTLAGQKISGRGYRTEDTEVMLQSGLASAFSAAMVLALYVDSIAVRQLYDFPWMIWPLAPLVLYINMRVWILARRGEMHDDPVVFIISDWRSQIIVALGGLLLLAAALA